MTSGLASLTGNNTYTGGTTISAGTLAIGGAGVLGGGTYSGTIANGGALVFNTSSNQTLSGAISGNGDLVPTRQRYADPHRPQNSYTGRPQSISGVLNCFGRGRS